MAPPSEPIATRDIDSTPPAITSSSNPERIDLAARLTDSRPEPQKRFSCTPATVSGIPAAVAAVRAMSMPWSPTGVTQPRITSEIRCSSRSGNRPRSSSIRPTTRSIGFTPCNAPLRLPVPRGVRMASKMKASVMAEVMARRYERGLAADMTEQVELRDQIVHMGGRRTRRSPTAPAPVRAVTGGIPLAGGHCPQSTNGDRP